MNFEGARMLPQSIHLIMPHLMQCGLQKSGKNVLIQDICCQSESRLANMKQ
jgi:hypothetical protein